MTYDALRCANCLGQRSTVRMSSHGRQGAKGEACACSCGPDHGGGRSSPALARCLGSPRAGLTSLWHQSAPILRRPNLAVHADREPSSCGGITGPSTASAPVRSVPAYVHLAPAGGCLALASQSAHRLSIRAMRRSLLRYPLQPMPAACRANFGRRHPERKPSRFRFLFPAALPIGSSRR